MNPNLFPYALWAGTEDSLEQARAVFAAIMADITAGVQAGHVMVSGDRNDGNQVPKPYNYDLQGSVGIIGIRGPLLNIDSEYARYRGATTYPDIRRALVFAAMDPGAKALVLDIDSGGGAVAGVEDVSTLVRYINDNVKPVASYTAGHMASAAYWTGVSAGTVFNGKTAVLGSVGVISTHVEYSKMLEKDGITATVVRSGEHKALASAVEPLSKAALAQMQATLDATYAVFRDTTASMLGMPVATFEATAGQGRIFVGEAAVDVGLSKGITSFDTLISAMNQKILDAEAKSSHNLTYSPGRNDHMSRQALTTQQVADLIAKGPEAVAAELAAAAAAASGTVTPPVQTAAAPAPAPAVTTTTAAAPAPAPAAQFAANAVADYLTGQLATANAELASTKALLATAQAEATAAKALVPSLTAVVAGSLATMRVALNMAAVDYSKVTPEALLADHAEVSKAYGEAFRPGGVAAAAAVTGADKTTETGPFAGIDPLALAQATRARPYPNK